MVCCPVAEVSEEAMCDVNGDLKSKAQVDTLSKDRITALLYSVPECGQRSDLTADRIAGGQDAPPGDWPWMALLSYQHRGASQQIFDCGGTLISLKTVLTSAHCLNKR